MLRGDPAGLMNLKVDLDNVGCLFSNSFFCSFDYIGRQICVCAHVVTGVMFRI